MKSIPGIILSKIIGFLVFLVLLAIANILIPSINSEIYTGIVYFFNLSIFLIFVITVVGMINDILWRFYFPFNILAPISAAFLSMYLITFLYSIWDFINLYIESNTLSSIVIPLREIYLVVFILILFLGYLTIIIRGGLPRDAWKEKWEDRYKKRLERKLDILERKKKRNEPEWEDVGNQFRLAFYNLGDIINNLFDKKPEKKKK
jgi:hypothetical protein